MQKYTGIFKRVEKKFIINSRQRNYILDALASRLVPDKFGASTISNIYFDTDNFSLIRTSLAKPVYKEKLRLRGYGKITDDTNTFVELKKKFKGVVYKRRINLPYSGAYDYLYNGAPLEKESQISHEIDWFRQYYTGLEPKMFISYNRTAFYDKNDPDLRITFDTDITWRDYDLDLKKGVYGQKLTQPGEYVMEIKLKDAMPLWLCEILSAGRIYQSSYSKYGNAFLQMERQMTESQNNNIVIFGGGTDCA